jgi:alkylhydroperoxidase family enzyme
LLGAAERSLGKRLVANRLLGWYPKALIGSSLLEAFVAHDEPETPKRLLTIVRLFVSFRASCPFCIDMNAKYFSEAGLTELELDALRLMASDPELAPSAAFSTGELAAIRYAASITATPVSFDADNIALVKELFGERGMVILASTAAQVNFWARLIQGLGAPPAGFSSSCSVLHLDEYRTLRNPS